MILTNQVDFISQSIKDWQARREELKQARTKLYEQMGDM